MANRLTTKDDHWRKRPNAATAVVDPGLAPLGADEEAGGASSPPEAASRRDREPLPMQPEAGGIGLRLTPRVWYAIAAVFALIVLMAAALSF